LVPLRVEFSQTLDGFRGLGDHFHEALGFSGRHPGQMEPLASDAGQLEQLLGQSDLFFRLNITFQVMAVADVSAGYQRAVTALPQRSRDEDRIHPTRAHHPDGANIGGVLHAGHPRQVGPGVGAPVA
jgi:hypothetical protein